MQARIRDFVREYNRRHGATVILTSHYMADVTALCERVIVIHHGRLLYDGNLRRLVEERAPYKGRLVLRRPRGAFAVWRVVPRRVKPLHARAARAEGRAPADRGAPRRRHDRRAADERSQQAVP
jgi:ABC-type multidrug transport system ATPase subunit